MSKDSHSTNFRLLGSPVNFCYRGKKKEDKKNIRNRPRSALHNSAYKPDYHDRYRRPYSADANLKSSGKDLQKSFGLEVIQCASQPIKVVSPTKELLGHSRSFNNCDRNRDLCSNGSDYGSEDTFVSLGTKIKARAQSVPKTKSSKNLLKYRNIAKMEKNKIKDTNNLFSDYNLEVKITEKAQGDNCANEMSEFDLDPFDDKNFDFSIYNSEPYVHHKSKGKEKMKSSEMINDIKKAGDYYSRQLSLVEEESPQDFSSISPQNSLEHKTNRTSPIFNIDEKKQNKNDNLKDDETHKEKYKKMTQNFVNENVQERSYSNFYDDLQINSIEPYTSRLSSTIGITDESYKDSGYTDSGSNEDKPFKRTDSSSTVILSKTLDTSLEQPKNLDSDPYTTFQKFNTDIKKNKWIEPINHSRLLYKDFFIRKDCDGPKVPENSPNKNEKDNYEEDVEKSEYPSYLLNSSTKAYTSKVIEDYKKELAAINNFHELTMKDIKVDAISPTPLNINEMFEQNSGGVLKDTRPDSRESNSSEKLSKSEPYESNRSIYQSNWESNKAYKSERDISNISTKELIQNYLKVKDNDYSKSITRNLKNTDRKYASVEKNLNNKPTSSLVKSDISTNVKNNLPSKPPLSARIESVQNDKDIDSWMSLNCPKSVDELKENFKPTPLGDDKDELSNTKGTQLSNINSKSTDISNVNCITNELSKGDGMSTETTTANGTVKELTNDASVLDIYSMLKEIEGFGDNPVNVETESKLETVKKNEEHNQRNNFMEIFDFLEKVEQSANEALSVVTSTAPQTIPKLEYLLKLPQTELAQRLVTLSLQLEERSCCIALLQESLTNHKQQMVSKVSALEKSSNRNITKVKQECDVAIKRHQNFIDQLINDKKTLNHRIEQLVDERRSLEERWKRQAQALEDRYKLELKNQHDKMNAAQQVARQRWVRQKAEKIKELTVKGLEGELRDMADRQQKEVSDLKMHHAEQIGRIQSKHAVEMEEMRQRYENEKEAMLLKERQMASARLEKQILELEISHQEQRTRLIAEMRAENERVASGLSEREKNTRQEIEQWKAEQEKLILQKKNQLELEIAREKENMEEEIKKKRMNMQEEFETYKKQYEAEQQVLFKKKEKEISAQYKQERDKEIEKAIESMETEAQVGRKELQEALRRNKEQYELELKELAETEQATLKRYQDAQARIRITETKCAELEVNISQLETRNRLLIEKNTQLEVRANEIRASCEESWRNKMDDLKKEIDNKTKTHEEQMHQLYAKVKIAVARKDSAIQALTREMSKAQEKITLLEQKLKVQRNDFLKHK